MPSKTKHLITHGVALLLTFGFAALVLCMRPALTKDATTTVGSVGSFITLYGVVCALIELAYTRSAAELAARESRKVFDAMSRLGAVEQISDCQAFIKTAVACIDDGVAVPSSIILDIVKIYSRVFQVQLEDATSEHRKNRSFLESYRFDSVHYNYYKHNAQVPSSTTATVSPRRPLPHPYAKVRQALVAIAGQLSSHQSKHTTFSEIGK